MKNTLHLHELSRWRRNSQRPHTKTQASEIDIQRACDP